MRQSASFTSVSLEPRLVLVCLSGASRTLAALLEAGVFSVNVLTECQEEVARRFADPCRPAGSGAFAGIPFTFDAQGCPRLDDSLASFACRVHAVHDGGDHADPHEVALLVDEARLQVERRGLAG